MLEELKSRISLFNKQTVFVNSEIALVPYNKHLVQTYHGWMNEEMLKATSSEPLTIKEEYEMQNTWIHDTDKITFILLDLKKWISNTVVDQDELNEHEANCTFGDINMFLTEEKDYIEGEISVMIALDRYRRKGNATNIVKCFINLLRAEIGVTDVRAKIDLDNTASINLFKNKLKFKEESICEPFQQVTLVQSPTDKHFDEINLISYEEFRKSRLSH